MSIENVKTVAVIGAGVMGQQIAMNTAIKGREAGFRVLLCDSFAAAAEKAAVWADQYLEGRVKKGRLTQEEADEAKSRIIISTDVDSCAKEAGLIIEAIIEKLEVKQELFERISRICGKDTVLSTKSPPPPDAKTCAYMLQHDARRP